MSSLDAWCGAELRDLSTIADTGALSGCRTQRNCSRWNETDVFVQIARTLNLTKEQRATLLSARTYLNNKFDK
jgi:hypothetical protein